MNEIRNSLLCLDLGNTSCRSALFQDSNETKVRTTSTSQFLKQPEVLLDDLASSTAVAYCSVVPSAEEVLLHSLAEKSTFAFSIEARALSSLPIRYPNPAEIGADRLANAYAVHHLNLVPAIVVDLGTATTFDVISLEGGYEGGVIVPGPQGMLDFLGTRTAMLPALKLDDSSFPQRVIGHTTSKAMLSGVKNGYVPMLEGIVKSIEKELLHFESDSYSLIQTGGQSQRFPLAGAIQDPLLTMKGIRLAYWNENPALAASA